MPPLQRIGSIRGNNRCRLALPLLAKIEALFYRFPAPE
jgi:hypothetical protein